MIIPINNTSYTNTYNRLSANKADHYSTSKNNTENNASNSSMKDVLDNALSNITDTDSAIHGKLLLARNNFKGEKVFDLDGIKDNLQNTLLSTDVYMYIEEETGRAVFECYFQKPNSTEPIKLQIHIENYDPNRSINKETLFKSVEKTVSLLDKVRSIKTGLGDTTPDVSAVGINLNYGTGELDFKPLIDAFKQSFSHRLDTSFKGGHLINVAADQMAILKAIQEFEEFILDYI